MGDPVETIQEAAEKPESRLNTYAGLLVAVTATFMALCNVKDGNVVQAMQQAQTRAVDQWAYYQAKSTKQAMAENSVELLGVQRDTTPGLSKEARPAFDARIAALQASAKRYEKEKDDIKAEAERNEKAYDTLNTHDDQFDMAEAGLTVAMALFGITILTQKRWMLLLACAFSAFGFVMGLAGFLQWNLHPDWLAKLLG
jgi:hypothetical protein